MNGAHCRLKCIRHADCGHEAVLSPAPSLTLTRLHIGAHTHVHAFQHSIRVHSTYNLHNLIYRDLYTLSTQNINIIASDYKTQMIHMKEHFQSSIHV
jgi:hypothetical protein